MKIRILIEVNLSVLQSKTRLEVKSVTTKPRLDIFLIVLLVIAIISILASKRV